jgi:DNA-binding transcriptional LysR family regulator
MELRQLRYLAAVLDSGTFAAAAEREHLSQPALWQQVRALEREWDVKLFERIGRRVRPTAAATSLVPRIRHVLDAAGQLGGDVAAIRQGSAVPARYAATRYARSSAFMFEVIARYLARYPGSPLPQAIDVGTARVIEALETGQIDLAAAVPPPNWPYRSEPLYEVRLEAVGLDISGDSIDVSVLARRPLALMTSAFGSRVMLEDLFRRRGISPQIIVEHDSPDALVAAARSGLATAVLVSDSLPVELDLPTAEVRDQGRSLGGTLCLIWRDDESLTTAARRLKEEAISHAGEVRAERRRMEAGPPAPPGARPPRRQVGRGRCTPGRRRDRQGL